MTVDNMEIRVKVPDHSRKEFNVSMGIFALLADVNRG